jgi:plastocyanin
MSTGGALRPLAAAACVLAAAALSGCELRRGTNVVNGKQLFVAKCGGCHTLARAGTTGVTGPNLDQAFARSRQDGFGQSTFRGVVRAQILHPDINPEADPITHKPLARMPAGIVKGADADDVAAYVAQAAARPGKDTGPLAAVGVKKAQGTAKESAGKLDIPVASAGLAFQFANAQATAGKVTLVAKNPQPIGHNIAVEGNGVSAHGPVVAGGKTSTVSVTLKPGTYTFFCSVPGHREGGMVGKITVK